MNRNTSKGIKPGHKRSHVANLLVLATTLVAALLLVEVLTRWLLPQEAAPLGGHDPTGLRIYDPEFGVVHTPNFAGPWVRGALVQTNSIGLRDREYGPKGDHEIRILSLGDSYAFGYGVELPDSYPKVLERRLSEEFPDLNVSVINGATSGYNTHQQILTFEKLFPLLNPDFVLATFVADNDVFENIMFHDALIQKVNTPVGWLSQHSRLVRLVVQATHPATYFLLNRWRVDYTISLLAELQQRFEAANLPYLMLVIPARHQLSRRDLHPGSHLLRMLGLDWLILHHNRMIMAHFESAQSPYLDLQPTLAEHDLVERVNFDDDSHLNEIGHRIVGKEICRRIRGEVAKLSVISPRPPRTSGDFLSDPEERRATGSRVATNRWSRGEKPRSGAAGRHVTTRSG